MVAQGGQGMTRSASGGDPPRVEEICVGREVAVSGRLDVTTVADVRLALHGVLERGSGDLLIHLAQAEVHDATGLGVIVGIHHRARRLGRRLILVDASARLDRLLRASRLHRVIARGAGDGDLTVLGEAGSVSTLAPPRPNPETVAPFTE
jgi:anti-sigma B factor antagonist